MPQIHLESTNLCVGSDHTSWQGRIYVANEYPTFERTMLMVGQKLTFTRQITLTFRQNLSALMKNMQTLG